MEFDEVYIQFTDSAFDQREDGNYEGVEVMDSGWVKFDAKNIGGKKGGHELHPPEAIEFIRTY